MEQIVAEEDREAAVWADRLREALVALAYARNVVIVSRMGEVCPALR